MGTMSSVACQNSHDCAHASDGEWLVSRIALTSCRWQNLRGGWGAEQWDGIVRDSWGGPEARDLQIARGSSAKASCHISGYLGKGVMPKGMVATDRAHL